MEDKVKVYYSILLNICLVAGAVILGFNTVSNRLTAMTLFAVFAALTLYHNWQNRKAAGLWRWGRPFIFIEFALALWLQVFDRTIFSGFAVMTVIAKTLLTERLPFCIAFTIASLAASITVQYLSLDSPIKALPLIGTILLPRLFMIIALAVARYNSVISGKNRHLTDLLQQKTSELEISLSKLKAYADDLKETADLRARDRLMRDLHDTLGHTLATASINAQAVSVLIDQDTSAAKVRLATVTQQIQTAMQSLRDVLSGKAIDYSDDAHTSEQFLDLMRETEKRTEIPIHVSNFAAEDYDALPVSCRSFLYNALMEGLTNGIRHGGATRFEVSLTRSGGTIDFTLSDNGKGFLELSLGYGLSKISRDAQRLGGLLEMTGRNGCRMRLVLPVRDGQESEGPRNG